MKCISRVDVHDQGISLAEIVHVRVPTVISVEGKDIALLYPFGKGDRESAIVGTDRRFMAMIQRSRKRLKYEGGIQDDEIRRLLGIPKSRLRNPKAGSFRRHIAKVK